MRFVHLVLTMCGLITLGCAPDAPVKITQGARMLEASDDMLAQIRARRSTSAPLSETTRIYTSTTIFRAAPSAPADFQKPITDWNDYRERCPELITDLPDGPESWAELIKLEDGVVQAEIGYVRLTPTETKAWLPERYIGTAERVEDRRNGNIQHYTSVRGTIETVYPIYPKYVELIQAALTKAGCR